ncbi:DUF429 domain-containing protein [Natronospirillum operosum]|uniref:DUF429 domain-containing protein n=1 Tax=Natronospirillum operosum TaxID=2759953 RepID=A0A4Z0WD88_9GAMM|nr:DUF429 domain-containing protein [Natronospirillum operosum]TGG91782.1 DUF429 domain-containing protein [Natronospirillum operosum]
MESSQSILIVGFDSAWTAKNRGALVGALWRPGGTLMALDKPTAANFDEALKCIQEWQQTSAPDQTLIMIDQPTIVPNESGQRPVENIVSSVISRRYGGMQPANRSKAEMFGDQAPIWTFLEALGGASDPLGAEDSIAIFEVYPTLALVALNWIRPDEKGRSTGRFPKYNPANHAKFKSEDWVYLCQNVAAELRSFGSGMEILAQHLDALAMKEKPRKADQDDLDACLCLIIGCLYLAGEALMIGRPESGFIVTPYNDLLVQELMQRLNVIGLQESDWLHVLDQNRQFDSKTEPEVIATHLGEQHSRYQGIEESEEPAVTTAKDRVHKVVSEQPDDASYEDIVRALAFEKMVERGLADARAGRVVSHEELRKKVRSWRR